MLNVPDRVEQSFGLRPAKPWLAALETSAMASHMTRQIALGAVLAFSVTVIALSLWEPKPVVDPPAATPAPAMMKLARPMSLKQDLIQTIRSPAVFAQPVGLSAADAGL